MIAKIALFAVFLVGANCFYLNQEFNRPTEFEDLEDLHSVQPFEYVQPVHVLDREFDRPTAFEDLGDLYSEQPFEYIRVQPVHVRHRRQVHGVVNTNPDGTTNIMAKLPLAGNDKNILSAVGGLDGVKTGGGFGAGSAGLALDNVNGHGLSLTGKHIPNFGDQLTAAAKVNLANTGKHDLNANAFATRTLPNNPVIPNFNTYGGGVDYMFDKKVGASLGVAHTPQWQKTDYSAMGKLNLFHDRTSSLDFGAGVSKSVSPFIPNRSWQPTFGLSFSKYF